MSPAVIPPGKSRVFHAFGEELHLHLDSGQTGGAFAMFTEITPPGGGPPPHWHEREDECFYVLEGTVSFLSEGQWLDVAAGGTVLAPRGLVHTFKNNTSETTRMLVRTYPGGFEEFFSEAAQEFARPEGPDMQRAVQIATSYGIHFVGP